MHNKVVELNMVCKNFQWKTSTWSLRWFNLPSICKNDWKNDVLKIQKKINVDVDDLNEKALANSCLENLLHKKYGG